MLTPDKPAGALSITHVLLALSSPQHKPSPASSIGRWGARPHRSHQEFVEEVVEHQDVDALGRVLLAHRSNVFANLRGYIFQLLGIVANLVE